LVSRYRLFNPFSNSHLHTTDQNEYNVLGTWGFLQEGARSKIFNAPAIVGGTGAVPLYRIYNIPGRRHFWTTDRNEYLTLIRIQGIYHGEASDGFMMPVQVAGTIPLYRLHYCCASPHIHHWTEDLNEYTVLGARGDWQQEGIAGYIYPLSTVTPANDKSHRSSAAASPEILTVVNAASKQAVSLAPNQLAIVVGRNLPEKPEVWIGGQAVRVLSASEKQISILTPPDLPDGESLLEVRANGILMASRQVRVAPVSPGIFTKDEQFGVGHAVFLDERGQAAETVERGSAVTMFVTGYGSEWTNLPIAAWIGGHPAEVISVQPKDTEGTLAVTIRVPALSPVGEYVPVSLRIREGITQPGASIPVR
jgi:uncharacterized protein (TIGR03437 family)